MLISLEGEEACGKTTFAYTAPLKVVGFSFDLGAERALFGAKAELFNGCKIKIVPYDKDAQAEHHTGIWKDYDIVVFELPRPIQLNSVRVRGAQALWDYFLELFVDALQDESVRSAVLDTATLARRVRVDAHLETLQSNTQKGKPMRERLLQIEYGMPNDAIRDLYNFSQGVKKNLIAVHHLTDEYADRINKNGEKEQVITGRRILEGLKGTHRIVDVALLMEKKGREIVGTPLKVGYNLALEGLPLRNPTWDKVANSITMSLGNRIEIERRNHD